MGCRTATFAYSHVLVSTFRPHFGILTPRQKALWPAFASARKAGYVLHGGAGIALRLGHRDSEDFAFFTVLPLDRTTLLEGMPALATATPLQDQPETLVTMLDGLKVSFFGRITFGRVGEPELTPDGVAFVASLRDLLAQKLKVVMQRLESKDYRDIAAILRHGEGLAEGMGAASALFGPSFSPAECTKALVYFKGGDLDTLPIGDKATLLDHVRALDWDKIPQVPILSPSLQPS
jgi:hypothetical protein